MERQEAWSALGGRVEDIQDLSPGFQWSIGPDQMVYPLMEAGLWSEARLEYLNIWRPWTRLHTICAHYMTSTFCFSPKMNGAY